MKNKILSLLLIITSLFGFLQWGGGNSLFLFQAEAQLLSKLIVDPVSVVHPFTLLPLAGQILLLITLFQQKPNKIVTFVGMAGLSILLVFMFIIGLMSINLKIVFSTLPFLLTAIITLRYYRKENK